VDLFGLYLHFLLGQLHPVSHHLVRVCGDEQLLVVLLLDLEKPYRKQGLLGILETVFHFQYIIGCRFLDQDDVLVAV